MRTSQAVLSSETEVTPVSWVNQASFEPLGLTLAIPKPENDDSADLAESIEPEFQLDEILKNHERVRSRYVEGDEVRKIVEQLLKTSDAERVNQVGFGGPANLCESLRNGSTCINISFFYSTLKSAKLDRRSSCWCINSLCSFCFRSPYNPANEEAKKCCCKSRHHHLIRPNTTVGSVLVGSPISSVL